MNELQSIRPMISHPNTACTPAKNAGAEPARSPAKYAGATLAPGAHPLAPYARTGVPRTQVPGSAGVVVGLPPRGVRVFKQVSWLGVGFGKVALSRPTPSG
jgi:hypothetical protein